ncbi:major pollen allergen Ole e 6-like [Punica granatum]|uniref:Major pollen allergen Ole e 6-like n=1 Tax=Punica granatum TaxID=22663 RepID=A0A218WPZ9_PUNGR|nr:major pollen allergen Ole e 6-like [Punica granatum]OWM74301.1 hypothetical protein CDL15_Pgr008615 [Punica granatum]
MAGRVAGLLVLCLVFATAVQVIRAQMLLDQYRQCFKDCHDSCETEGNGNTFCEMKCDGDCMAKETAAKLDKVRQDMAAGREAAQNSGR